jgi:hypothetical protein
MAYQVRREKCIQTRPKNRIFDRLKLNLPVTPMRIEQNTAGQPGFASQTSTADEKSRWL